MNRANEIRAEALGAMLYRNIPHPDAVRSHHVQWQVNGNDRNAEATQYARRLNSFLKGPIPPCASELTTKRPGSHRYDRQI